MGLSAARTRLHHFVVKTAFAALMLAAMALLVVPQQVFAESPDDISAYQAQYEQRVFPPGPYPGAPVYARQKLMERLKYAMAQYIEARQSRNRSAARH